MSPNASPSPSPRASHSTTSGFTLIELLVVQGIIAILIGFMAPEAEKLEQTAEAMQAKPELAELGTRLGLFEDGAVQFLARAESELGLLLGGAGHDFSAGQEQARIQDLDEGFAEFERELRSMIVICIDAAAEQTEDEEARTLCAQAARQLASLASRAEEVREELSLLLPAVKN